MNWTVLKSIFKRDFVSYFSSPTGYVFICVFVVLSSLATFWPPDFFSSNLANLDQLSRWLPFIMLVFIPAITMSIWAEERRQGTDELLLTIPASDFDVVLGKYLAGVATFTVSLLFSAFSIFLVFQWGLGQPDVGLFISTYIGYWFIGIAMIAIGMVASFITDNLTVGFILGTLFNLPLAMFGVADWYLKNPAIAQTVRQWSALEQFRDFERGVISLGGLTYFVMIAAVMVYLSMVLIGRRHWQARQNGGEMLGHYLVRTLALLVLAIGLTQYVRNHNWVRADISSEQLSSLSDDTLQLLRELRNDDDARTINVDAYVSPQVPTEYAATKLNFLSTLQELQALSGNKIKVALHEIENYGPEAILAETTYGITPQAVVVTSGSERSSEELFLAAAISSGPDNVVIPFVDKGIPVEYELVRSISTVSQTTRLKLGVVDPGGLIMGSPQSRQSEWPLITELRKQYDLGSRPVDLSKPIGDHYDVLLAIQPSMLGHQELDHLVDAVRAGTPTAILEDPHPHYYPQEIPATSEPKQSRMSMFGGGAPEPKGDIQQLWRTLGIRFDPIEIVWQAYAPDKSVRSNADEQWVFIDEGNGAQFPFNPDNAISAGLNQLLLIYPGSLVKDQDSPLTFEQLAVTGHDRSGTVETMQLRRRQRNSQVLNRQLTSASYILAAHIFGTLPEDDLLLDQEAEDKIDDNDGEGDENEIDLADIAEATSAETGPQINAVVVADIDWILPDFFFIRQSGDNEFLPATQNVTFILNVVDALAGEARFLSIRKRTRQHRTLTKIDQATKMYRDNAVEDQEEFVKEVETKLLQAQQRFEAQIAEVENRKGLSATAIEQLISRVRAREQDRLQAEIKAIESERNRKVKQIRYQMEQDVRSVQDLYKMYAILIPPIPPLLVALFVFFRRREAEREGISQERLR